MNYRLSFVIGCTINFVLVWFALTFATAIAWVGHPFVYGGLFDTFHRLVIQNFDLYLRLFAYSVAIFWLSLWLTELVSRLVSIRLPEKNAPAVGARDNLILCIQILYATFMFTIVFYKNQLRDTKIPHTSVSYSAALAFVLVCLLIVIFVRRRSEKLSSEAKEERKKRRKLSCRFYAQLTLLVPFYVVLANLIAPRISQVDPVLVDYHRRKGVVAAEHASILQQVDELMKSHGVDKRWDADISWMPGSELTPYLLTLLKDHKKILFSGQLESIVADEHIKGRQWGKIAYQQRLVNSGIFIPIILNCELTSEQAFLLNQERAQREAVNISALVELAEVVKSDEVIQDSYSKRANNSRYDFSPIILNGRCVEVVLLADCFLAGKSWRPWITLTVPWSSSGWAFRLEVASIEDLPMAWPFL